MRTVTVTGHGEARVAPDSAVVRVSAVHRAPGVAEALAGADSAASRIAETAHGFTTPEQVGSTSLQIWPSHDELGRPDGFRASHAITIRCADIDAAGRLLSALADEIGGRLEVEGVSLEVADPSEVRGTRATRRTPTPWPGRPTSPPWPAPSSETSSTWPRAAPRPARRGWRG